MKRTAALYRPIVSKQNGPTIFYVPSPPKDRSIIGPMFTREAAVAPRRVSFFAARTLLAAALFALTLTAWQLLVGSQPIESIGDLAWFGAAAFQILAPLQ